MDPTDESKAIVSMSRRTRAKKTLVTSNEDHSDRMEDKDTMVFPNKLLKRKSQKRESKVEDVICKTSNVKVLKQTKEVQPSAPASFPTLVKIMDRSNVAGWFWLNLPKNFCNLHLPKEDVIITLEDDDGAEFNVKYLWARAGLSGGWRGFSIAHKLSKGDKLVFCLVKPLKFKVHIIRLNDSNEADEALTLVSSYSSFKEINSVAAKDPRVSRRKADKYHEDIEVEIIEDHSRKDELKNSASNTDHVLPHKLRKLKSQKSKSKVDDGICKTNYIEVLKQTKEVQPSVPAFVRIMVHSNVAGSFWLHIPNEFSNLHLPKEDVIMTLEDDDGVEYNVKYLWARAALSGGWKGFSIAHKLSNGDKLVFQLVKPLKFKVHIIRLNNSNEYDKALNLVMSGSSFEEVKSAKDSRVSKRKADKHCEDPELEIIEDHTRKDELKNFACNTNHVKKIDDSTSSSLLDVSDGVHLQESTNTNFKDVRSIEDFVIAVHDVVIDSAVSEHVRNKYYELCCSQKSYLHIHLFKSLDSLVLSSGITSETVMMLSAGVISAVVDIADAIRASTVTTSPENFAIWKRGLQQLERLGMDVGFLLDRLIQLGGLAHK